ncbi:AEC family transporter [Oceanicoccus sp. KOV_DT_Chl]|uniref:AEC family transporter n=1 Tax=Oceanicoccus sp. KOV_DT_Chl TaxID=1904639 RepID=UPI001358298F|nr:AEC family transporter [Oceanicoccus sp. KOV_DT_Chl]
MPAQALIDTLLAATLVLLFTGLLATVICRWFKLSLPVYLGPLLFPNTVNMGLPVCLFAFGEEGLAIALGIYLVVSLTQFSLGIALVSGQSAWRNTWRSPIVYSGLIGATLIFTDTQLPLWLEQSLNLLGSFSIPIMLITLGVSLAQLKVKDFALSTGLALCRLAIGLSVGFLVAEILDLEGAARGVLIIQSSMPAAVFNYLLAHRYGRSPEAVAGLVVMSTLISFVSMPALLWLVL